MSSVSDSLARLHENEFARLWGCAVSADERIRLKVREFTAQECEAVLDLDDYARHHGGYCEIQSSVRKAVESRLRRLTRKGRTA